MMPYIPVRAKIFHMLPDLVENLRSLIASRTQRQTAPSVDVEISFFSQSDRDADERDQRTCLV